MERERILKFCIKMFVSLKARADHRWPNWCEISDFWPWEAKFKGTKISASGDLSQTNIKGNIRYLRPVNYEK